MVKVAIIPFESDVAANTDISLPQPYPDIAELVSAVLFRKTDVVHDACAATDAAYSSATTLASPINGATVLTVVTATPSSGQIQKTGRRTVQLGDAVKAGEFLLLVYIAKGEMSGY